MIICAVTCAHFLVAGRTENRTAIFGDCLVLVGEIARLSLMCGADSTLGPGWDIFLSVGSGQRMMALSSLPLSS
jgi:hypothetical protein